MQGSTLDETTLTDPDATRLARPDQEELNVIVQELSTAKSRLAQSRVLLALAEADAIDGHSILHLRFKGTGRATPTIPWLLTDIAAWEAAVGVMQRLYDDWQAREDAYLESRPETSEG